jgi:hypothetical protein
MKPFGWKRAVKMAESIITDANKLSGVVEDAVKKMDDVTVIGLALAAAKAEIEEFRDCELRGRA